MIMRNLVLKRYLFYYRITIILTVKHAFYGNFLCHKAVHVLALKTIGIMIRMKKICVLFQIFDGPRTNMSKKGKKIDRNIYLSFGILIIFS